MRANAVIVAATQVDWQKLLVSAKQILNRSISNNYDKQFKTHDIPVGFQTSLGEVAWPSIDILAASSSPITARHVFFSLAIVCPEDYVKDFISECKLDCIYNKSEESHLSYLIVSGSLHQWREAVNAASLITSTTKYRGIIEAVVDCFETAGIRVPSIDTKVTTLSRVPK